MTTTTQKDHGPISRRSLLTGTAVAATATALGGMALAEDQGQFLFVQTADSMKYDADSKTLTLIDISPVTLFFSDRPERIAGNMSTSAFIPFWAEGKNSFLADAPNADISIVEDGKLRQTVVILHDPVLADGNLTYTVEMIDNEPPATGTEVSVFIDVIGMPLTPLSVAGVRRRAFRRAALY